MTYEKVMDYLYSQLPMFQRQGGKALKPGLRNIEIFCDYLDNPQNQFKSLHLAGTNGKGSTAHSITSILMEAGYKVGLYTSPHLKDYRERIRLNGQLIPKEFVIDFVNSHQKKIEKLMPSFFEISVAMAFSYFNDQKVDIAIIETGLGGRLDSTNIIHPLVSVITSIGMDHAHILGDTLNKIAFEKAGIIKNNVPVVLPKLLPQGIRAVFEEVATKNESKINSEAEFYQLKLESNQLNIYKNEDVLYANLIPGIKGNFYLKNIPTIIEAIEELRECNFIISDVNIKEGIEKVVQHTGLKGRWQKLGNKPLLITDLGHNEDGWNEILSQINNITFDQLRIVLGMVNDKEVDKIFDLLPSNAKYYLCEPKVPRAMSVEKLALAAHAKAFDYKICKDVNECMQLAIKESSESDMVFIGGSTFVVAEIDGL